MDCPFETHVKKVIKSLEQKDLALTIVIRGPQGAGKTTLAKWLQIFFEKLGYKCFIIEANDNMRTGTSNVENYSRMKVGAAHRERQLAYKQKLQQGFVGIISNCSINPKDLTDYTNSGSIKIKGCEARPCENSMILIFNLCPIPFTNKRNIGDGIKDAYFKNYLGRQFFNEGDVAQFATRKENVIQFHQVFLNQAENVLCYNETFDPEMSYVEAATTFTYNADLMPKVPEMLRHLIVEKASKNPIFDQTLLGMLPLDLQVVVSTRISDWILHERERLARFQPLSKIGDLRPMYNSTVKQFDSSVLKLIGRV